MEIRKGLRSEKRNDFSPESGGAEAVVSGLAAHVDELGKLLCPCNFYLDKQAEAKLRRWICACDEMQIYKYCHCLLFVREDGMPITEYLSEDHEGWQVMGSSPTRLRTRGERSGTRHRIMVPYHSPTTPGQRLD